MNNNSFQVGKNQVQFQSEGETIVGTLFLPEGFDTNRTYPAVIVDGPWTQVKEQVGYAYAAEIVERGLIALAFDHRFYGASGGSPRQFESATAKAEDISNAITFLNQLPFVESSKVIGLGVCAGAGNMILAATQDDRLKGLVTGSAWLQHPSTTPVFYGGEEGIKGRIEKAQAAKTAYTEKGVETLVEAYNPDNPEAAMFFPVDYYANPDRGNIPAWKNSFAVQGWQEWLELNTVDLAQQVKQPTLLVHSEESALPDNVRSFYGQLPGSKQLIWEEGEHTEFYDKKPQIQTVVDHLQGFVASMAGTTAEQNVQLIHDFFAAFGTVDRDWFQQHIDENLVWHMPGQSPISGDWKGIDGMINGIRATAMRMGNGKNGFELLEVFGNENGAMSIHRDFYTGDDNHFDLRYAIYYRIKHGRIMELFEIPFDQYENDRFWNKQAEIIGE